MKTRVLCFFLGLLSAPFAFSDGPIYFSPAGFHTQVASTEAEKHKKFEQGIMKLAQLVQFMAQSEVDLDGNHEWKTAIEALDIWLGAIIFDSRHLQQAIQQTLHKILKGSIENQDTLELQKALLGIIMTGDQKHRELATRVLTYLAQTKLLLPEVIVEIRSRFTNNVSISNVGSRKSFITILKSVDLKTCRQTFS